MKIKSIEIEAKKSEYPIQLFDSNNNLIYYENLIGYWEKQEFDSNSNKIYYETSNGYWYKTEFDSNNNQIYYENSYGEWSKSKYDSNSNVIYYENSDGIIRDKRPKQVKEMTVSEISKLLGYEVKIVK